MKTQVRVEVLYMADEPGNGIELIRPTIEDASVGMRWLAINATQPVKFVVTFEDVSEEEPKSRFINPEGGKKDA